MSQVASTVMTLVSTPPGQAIPMRYRHGLIRSTAPHRGDTTSTLAAMSTSPRSRNIITSGSLPIAGTRLVPRADPNT